MSQNDLISRAAVLALVEDAMTWKSRNAVGGYIFTGLRKREEVLADIRALPAAPDLSDPVVVHVNTLHGKIARMTPEQVRHVYPEMFAPAAPAVKVRPLVWCSAAMGRQYGAGDGVLYWVNSKMCVLFRTESGNSAWQHLPSGAHPRASIETAKAAAQADYDARTLAASSGKLDAKFLARVIAVLEGRES